MKNVPKGKRPEGKGKAAKKQKYFSFLDSGIPVMINIILQVLGGILGFEKFIVDVF